MLILRMLTGSRLYGTARPDSDFDWIEIWSENIKSSHSIVDGEDVQKWSLGTLMKLANKGAHNALDVLFAPVGHPEVDLIADLRANSYTDYWLCYPRFKKTMESLLKRGDSKGRMHAKRLEDNLEEIGRSGRYNTRWHGKKL